MFTPLVADPDLWGHVRFGQDLWQTGQIIRADPYSYLTDGQPWINHEWLTEAIDALFFRLFGASGLIALNLAMSLSIVELLYSHLVRRGVGLVAAGVIVLLFALPLRPGVLNVRPQVITYLLFLLVLLLISAVERGRTRCVWAIAPIIALWANLHGGVLAGVGVFLLWGVIHLASAAAGERRLSVLLTRSNLVILTSMIACPLALLLNPFGLRLLTFLLRTATIPRPEIAEWKPIAITSQWGQLFFAGLLVTVSGVVFSRRKRKPALMGALICATLLPLLSARHTPLFAVAAPALAGEHLADAARRCGVGRLSAWLAARIPVRLAALALPVAALALAGAAIPRLDGIRIDPASADFPVCAVALLKKNQASGDMITEFNWGEYVIWHLGPDVKVSVDGRRETVYPDDVYRENLAFMFGAVGWNRLLARGSPQLALVDRARPAFGLMMQQPGWRLLYEDSLCGLFALEDSPLTEQLAREAQPALPCNGKGLPFP